MTELEQLRVVAKAAAELERQFGYAMGVLEGYACIDGKVGDAARAALDRIKKRRGHFGPDEVKK